MWLLEQETLNKMAMLPKPSAEQMAEFSAAHITQSGQKIRALTIDDGVAKVSVVGVLTQQPDFWAWMMGGGNTTYTDLVSAIAEAESNDSVNSVDFVFDSPGGNIDGLFDAMDAIKAMTKTTRAIVNQAASAAYGLASQADEVIATGRASSVGSVGVVVSLGLRDDVVTITSTDAPDKRPDASTEAGRAVIREELDQIHDIFSDAIASGRNVSQSVVNTDYGRGKMYLADKALKAGMIDSIGVSAVSTAKTKTAASRGNKKGNIMNLEQLKADHPALYEAVKAEGATTALAKERDRVEAFLISGESSGEMQTAITAIRAGGDMTQALQSTFLMAAANRGNQAARQADSDAAAAAVDGIQTDVEAEDKDAKASEDLTSQFLALAGVGGDHE